MARITVDDVRGWVESSKLNITALDLNFLPQIETEVLARLGTVYDTVGWVDSTSTPSLVKVIITKMYAGWLYDKYYSENQAERNEYAQMLKDNAELLMTGLLDGTIEIPGTPATTNQGPSFYPNDISSARTPGEDGDWSLGPAKFSMGQIF